MQTPFFGHTFSEQSAAGMRVNGIREEKEDRDVRTPLYEEKRVILRGGGNALINQNQCSSSSTNTRDDIGEKRSFNAQDYYESYVWSEKVNNNNNRVTTCEKACNDRMWINEDDSDDKASNVFQKDVHLTQTPTPSSFHSCIQSLNNNNKVPSPTSAVLSSDIIPITGHIHTTLCS